MKKIKLYAGKSVYILVLVFSREKAVKIQNCGQSAGKDRISCNYKMVK